MRIATFTLTGLLFLLANTAFAQQSGIPPHGDGPLKVQVAVYVIDLQSVNSAKQSYTGNIMYRMRWMDPRLAHEGPGSRTRELDEVWHPNIQVVNRQRMFLTFPDEVEVSPSGEVVQRQRMWGDLTQATDLRNFPFDAHRFDIDLLAVGKSPAQVALVQDELVESMVAPDYTLPDWTITGWEAGSFDLLPVPGSSKAISGFRFSFEASRNTTYYLLKVILPLLLLATLSWLVFWISIEESSIQVSVSITTILTLIAYRFAIGSSLPAVSYMTRLDSMILGATVLTFAALGLVVIIQSLRRNDRLATALRLQRICRIAFPTALVVGVLNWLVL